MSSLFRATSKFRKIVEKWALAKSYIPATSQYQLWDFLSATFVSFISLAGIIRANYGKWIKVSKKIADIFCNDNYLLWFAWALISGSIQFTSKPPLPYVPSSEGRFISSYLTSCTMPPLTTWYHYCVHLLWYLTYWHIFLTISLDYSAF